MCVQDGYTDTTDLSWQQGRNEFLKLGKGIVACATFGFEASGKPEHLNFSALLLLHSNLDQ